MSTFKTFSFLLLCLTVFLQLGSYAVDTKEETPIKVKFQNESDHAIVVHVLSDTMIASSQYLEPHTELHLDVAFGNRIRLDYKPKPKQTLLSEMGSLNELNRTVLIRNDGETVFIQEKFSGQRVKGKGQKRVPKATISEPGLERKKSTWPGIKLLRSRHDNKLEPKQKF